MSTETKSVDRHIADLHLARLLRPYLGSRAFVLVVIIPSDQGAKHWKSAALDLLQTGGASDDSDSNGDEFDWKGQASYDDCHADVFEGVVTEVVRGKIVRAETDPFNMVRFGKHRTVLICRRGDASAVLASKLLPIADAVIDLPELDLELVRRAAKAMTGSDISIDAAAELVALEENVRAVLRRTGRGLGKVLADIRARDATTIKLSSSAKSTGPRLEDLHGYGDAKLWGLELARDLEDYAAGVIVWSDVDSGLLLSGPPGCGKTTFAQALARTCGVELVVGSYAIWQSAGHQGDMLKSMVKTFDAARQAAPCILLIDEVDAFTSRERDHHNADYMRGVVNGFLEQLDGAKNRDGVVVIGACNNPDVIDPAILRPGRLDRHIEIGLPDAPARSQILSYHLQSDLDTSSLLPHTAGFSGADLERLARDARRLARRARQAVSLEHVAASLPKMHQLSFEDIFATAVHELGHAVIGVVLGHRRLKRIVVRKEIFATAVQQSAGFAQFETRLALRKTKQWFEDEICLLLGAMAAEHLILGDHCDGSSQDLVQATDAATYMLTVAGFGKRLAGEGVEVDLAQQRSENPDLASAIDEILQKQLARAKSLISNHRALILQLAMLLADTGEINGAFVAQALRDQDQTMSHGSDEADVRHAAMNSLSTMMSKNL